MVYFKCLLVLQFYVLYYCVVSFFVVPHLFSHLTVELCCKPWIYKPNVMCLKARNYLSLIVGGEAVDSYL